MTLEDRITKIEQIAKKKQRDIEQATVLKNIKNHNDLLMQTEALPPRINDLIHVASKCHYENIKFPTDRQCEHYGYGNGKCNFTASCICHNLGFIHHTNHNITEIGILQTGAQTADIISDGSTITICYRNKQKIKLDVITENTYDENKILMSIHLCFYEWIDNLS